jgi:hypothetical protein
MGVDICGIGAGRVILDIVQQRFMLGLDSNLSLPSENGGFTQEIAGQCGIKLDVRDNLPLPTSRAVSPI